MESKKILTLCIVQQGDKVLLGMKKRGFGQGKWNGFGGKVKENEEIDEAARREILEEAGIVPLDMEKRGILEFRFQDNPEVLQVHLFRIFLFEGEPRETEEMNPKWFSFSDIPFEEMWADDKYWLPLFLQGNSLQGEFLFKDPDTLLDHKLRIT